MPTTTNFGWTTPADTDLVKNGASAMRTLGNGIDTSLAYLKGGTTGQILSKTSNTDLAFTWINNDQGDITAVTAGTGISGGGTSGAVTITNSMATEITAAGDIIVGTGSGTFDNLPIGTTGQVLTADTTVSPYKVKWATASSGGWTLDSTTTLSTGTTSINISSGYQQIIIFVDSWTLTANTEPYIRFNSDSTANAYRWSLVGVNNTPAFNSVGLSNAQAYIGQGFTLKSGSNNNNMVITLHNYASTTMYKQYSWVSNFLTDSSAKHSENVAGYWQNTSAITSIQFITASSSWSGGTVKVYGVK